MEVLTSQALEDGLREDQSQPVQLYDLSQDLGERSNLASKLPERVTELKALLELDHTGT